jgi:hypothetical protein
MTKEFLSPQEVEKLTDEIRVFCNNMFKFNFLVEGGLLLKLYSYEIFESIPTLNLKGNLYSCQHFNVFNIPSPPKAVSLSQTTLIPEMS